MKPIAIQLYTLRSIGEKDFAGMIKTVAETGYKGVEIAGLYGDGQKEAAKIIADNGLKVCSSHVGIPTKETAAQMAEVEHTMGSNTIISGVGPEGFNTANNCRKTADKFMAAVQLMKPYGIRVGYHNHYWEFEKIDGRYAYDIMMEYAPEVLAQLDVYWVAYGGADTAQFVAKYAHKAPLLHIKDGPLDTMDYMNAVGTGKLDMPKIIGAADENVLEWLIVELDACQGDMVSAVKESYRYLTTNKLASGNK